MAARALDEPSSKINEEVEETEIKNMRLTSVCVAE
jgi:hypothetical protein